MLHQCKTEVSVEGWAFLRRGPNASVKSVRPLLHMRKSFPPSFCCICQLITCFLLPFICKQLLALAKWKFCSDFQILGWNSKWLLMQKLVGFFVGRIKHSHGVYLYIGLITPSQMLHNSILRHSIWIKTMLSPPPLWGLPHLRGGMKERKWNSSSSSDVLFSSVVKRIICSGLDGGRLC